MVAAMMARQSVKKWVRYLTADAQTLPSTHPDVFVTVDVRPSNLSTSSLPRPSRVTVGGRAVGRRHSLRITTSSPSLPDISSRGGGGIPTVTSNSSPLRPRRTITGRSSSPVNRRARAVPIGRNVRNRVSISSSTSLPPSLLTDSSSGEDDESLLRLSFTSGGNRSIARSGNVSAGRDATSGSAVSNSSRRGIELGSATVSRATEVGGTRQRGVRLFADGRGETGANSRDGNDGEADNVGEETDSGVELISEDVVTVFVDKEVSSETIDLTSEDDDFPVVDPVQTSDTMWGLPSAKFLNPCVTLTLMFWKEGRNITDPSTYHFVYVCARWSRELLLNDHKAIINKKAYLDTQDEIWRFDGTVWGRVYWQVAFPVTNLSLVILKTKNAKVDIVL